MSSLRNFGLCTVGLLLICATQPGIATEYHYGFTTNTADAVPFNGSDYTSYTFDLTDTATNSNSVPALTLNDGDILSGTITLSSPFTLSATNAANREGAGVYLQLIDTGNQLVSMDQSMTFRFNGLDVTPPGYANYGGSEGEILIGKYITDDIPAFTFNEVDFSATMIGASDNDGEHASAALDSTNPNFVAIAYPAVPLPATVWLMLSGLGGLGAAMRSRKRQL